MLGNNYRQFSPEILSEIHPLTTIFIDGKKEGD
jgi:hypothetical protein